MIVSIPTQDSLLPPLLCQNVSPCHLLSGATCPPCFQLPTKQRTRSFLLCQSKLLSPRDAACQATVTLGDRLGPKNGRFSFLSATGRTTGHQGRTFYRRGKVWQHLNEGPASSLHRESRTHGFRGQSIFLSLDIYPCWMESKYSIHVSDCYLHKEFQTKIGWLWFYILWWLCWHI